MAEGSVYLTLQANLLFLNLICLSLGHLDTFPFVPATEAKVLLPKN